MKQRYARLHNNIVTHLVQVQDGWLELNAWPDVPGEWIACSEPVDCEWQYDPSTKVFLPPDNK